MHERLAKLVPQWWVWWWCGPLLYCSRVQVVPSAAGAAEELRTSFVERMALAERAVCLVVARARVEDPEALVAEVWVKAWAVYPRMVARERSGYVHSWPSWFAQIARRLVVDQKRRDEVLRRLYGVRVVSGPGGLGGGESGDVLDGVPSPGGDPWELVSDGERRAALVEALAGLGVRDVEILRCSAAGLPDRLSALVLGLSRSALKRARDRARVRLRALLRA